MINFIKEKKTIIFIILIIIILIGKKIYNSTQKYNNNVDVNQVVVNETKDEKEIEEKIIAVHITGAIKNAGVIRIEENSRIEDVIEKAGGLTEDADITNVNLAFIVEDGVKIGGICEYLKSILAENGILNTKLLGFDDKFFSHGTRDEILEAAGLSVNHIKRAIKQCAK